MVLRGGINDLKTADYSPEIDKNHINNILGLMTWWRRCHGAIKYI
jgi:hypothetical protein